MNRKNRKHAMSYHRIAKHLASDSCQFIDAIGQTDYFALSALWAYSAG